MFGAMLNYEQKGQTITLQYEKQIARIQVLTNKVINVFVPYETNDRRSKAIEGERSFPLPLHWTKRKIVSFFRRILLSAGFITIL